MVQFIPRIDLASLSADKETALARKALRAPQRFFNPEEASSRVFFFSFLFFSKGGLVSFVCQGCFLLLF